MLVWIQAVGFRVIPFSFNGTITIENNDVYQVSVGFTQRYAYIPFDSSPIHYWHASNDSAVVSSDGLPNRPFA